MKQNWETITKLKRFCDILYIYIHSAEKVKDVLDNKIKNPKLYIYMFQKAVKINFLLITPYFFLHYIQYIYIYITSY